MLFDFFHYLYTIKNNDIYDYFNCYSTALLTNPNYNEKILNHRANFLINYYLLNKNIKDKSYYYYYCRKNFIDDYLNIPLLPKKHPKKEIEFDNSDDDVIDHYRFITSRPPPKEEIDYDKLDEKFYLEEEEKNNKIDYEDEYDIYEDEYEDDYEYEDYDDIDYEEYN